MAGGKSPYLSNALLDHVLGGGDFARPATVYIGLLTSLPSDVSGIAEVTGGSYSRVSVANNATNWPAASGAACVRNDARPCADMREYCNAASLTCVRAAAVDASCVNGVPCVGYAQCKQNKCLADLTLGENCMVGPSEPECTGTLVCNSGTCKAPNAGMTCTL